MEHNPSGLGFMQFGFVPTIDGTTIRDNPYMMLKDGLQMKVPLLIGTINIFSKTQFLYILFSR